MKDKFAALWKKISGYVASKRDSMYEHRAILVKMFVYIVLFALSIVPTALVVTALTVVFAENLFMLIWTFVVYIFALDKFGDIAKFFAEFVAGFVD